jgi:uncharacterized protein (UPF0333 family)
MMKQNMNFTLIGLLVIVLVAMIAMTLYYQSQYSALSQDYKNSLKTNNNLTKELFSANARVTEKENELNEKIRNLNLSASEVARFGDINRNLTAEIKNIDFDKIYKSINQLKLETDSLENETLRQKLNREINTLQDDVVELENQFLTIKAQTEKQ